MVSLSNHEPQSPRSARPSTGSGRAGKIRLCFAFLVISALASLVSLSLNGTRVSAQGPPPGITVTTSLEPEEPRVGDRVRVTIEVEHPDDVLVSLVSSPARRPDFEIIEVQPPSTTPSAERGMLRTSFVLVVAPFALGPVEVGDFTLQALREDGSAQDFGGTLPSLQVRTTTRPDSELRPLKPQATIAGAPPAWLRPAMLGGAVLAVVVVLAIAALALRRRRQRGAIALLPPLPPATAEDTARRQLDALRAQDLLGAGDLEGYYGRLSSVVRAYLEERFAFRATALTSRELARRMAAEGLDRWQIRLVSGLLERCDAGVYARRFPPLPSADHDLTLAYEIVEFARPRRETEAPSAVPA
jgi:hypothetical protein